MSFCDHCAWASSHVHYCHRVTFPKVTSKKHQNILRSQSAFLVFRKWVSNNRVYFGVNQHTKTTISVSESFVDGPRWQTKCSAASWLSWSALIATSAWPNEKAMKYIISQEAFLHLSYLKTTIFVWQISPLQINSCENISIVTLCCEILEFKFTGSLFHRGCSFSRRMTSNTEIVFHCHVTKNKLETVQWKKQEHEML